MDPTELQKELTKLQAEIADRYGIKGRTLRDQVRKLGRWLPRYERGQARVLVEAETALQHPKMAMLVQPKPFHHAKTALMMHLEGIDPAERRKGMMLSIAATILVNVVCAIGVLALLWFLVQD
ncbi:hypothetical protein [Shimia ponticola]|uniref:hypothetical protein n=1 Tax=Shimia ponticola TaxID=2582893 RepID=UPI0011BEF382|nr:hypothetical protein [Shimia ponticola]